MNLKDDFYTILNSSQKEDGLSVLVKINKNHQIFKGHFPNHPVTPGVCTLQIIKELTEHHVQKNLFLKSARNVKFMAIINPLENEEVRFDLQIEMQKQDEFSVKANVMLDEKAALKFGGTFQVV